VSLESNFVLPLPGGAGHRKKIPVVGAIDLKLVR